MKISNSKAINPYLTTHIQSKGRKLLWALCRAWRCGPTLALPLQAFPGFLFS